MGIITKIEDKLGDIVEKPFKDKKSFEPLIIEVTIKRKLEANKKNILGKIVIPHGVSIILDETVYNDFKPFLEHFKNTLARSLSEWTREKGYEILQELDLQFKKGSLDERKFDIFVSFKSSEKTIGKAPSSLFSHPRGEGYEAFRAMMGRDRGGNESSGFTNECIKDGNQGARPVIGKLVNTMTGAESEILQGETILGRDKDCDVTISDPTVSRMHAFILFQHGKFILEDLGSTSGTRVNHEKVGKRVISDGDKITMGNTELVFKMPKRLFIADKVASL